MINYTAYKTFIGTFIWYIYCDIRTVWACGSSHLIFDCYVYNFKTIENYNVLDTEIKRWKKSMSICTCVSVWFSQNSSPHEQKRNILLLVWVHVYTTVLTNVVDACVLALKPGGNCARMYTLGRKITKEVRCNIMKKQRGTKT